MSYRKHWIATLCTSFLILSGCSFQGPGTPAQNNQPWDGKIYNQNSNIQYDGAQDLLNTLTFNGTETILDIGTRTGRIAAELSEKVPEGSVIGIDSSPSMIEVARQKHTSVDYPNLSFLQGDAETISYHNQFDYITTFWALHWIENKQAVFNNIFSALKLGGKALLYFGPDEGEHRLDQTVAEVAIEKRWPLQVQRLKSGFFVPTATEIHQMLTKSGLNVSHYKVAYKTETLSSKQAFIKWMSAWLPHLKYLDDKEKIAFTHAIADKYLSWRIQGKNGEVYYDDYMLEAIVTKPQQPKG